MKIKPILFIIVILILCAGVARFLWPVNKTTTQKSVHTITVLNSSVEQVDTNNSKPKSWETQRWGTNDGSFTFLPTGHTGSRSLKTVMTSYTSGDAKWIFAPLTVYPGEVYTFSDYYQSDTQTRIVVRYTKNDSTYIYKELRSAPLSSDWKHYQVAITIPQDVHKMTVYHLLSSVGYLITDDYQIANFVPVGFKRGIISITWDDGIATQYTKAFPIHKKYNLLGNFFLISSKLDTNFYMTTTQAKQIQNAGNELGSHTVTHPHLTTVHDDQLERELQKSQIDLQAKIGTSFQDFVTPYGDYNDQVLQTVKKYYRSHRSVEVGYNAKNNFDIYDIVVQNVYTTTKPSEVAAWVEKAKTDKTWLVLVYHQVDNPGDEYSVSSNDLDTEFKTIKNSGVPVETFDQAFKELLPQTSTN